MDYKEFMEQANKLEAQAAALRKQAEEAKAKDAAKNAAAAKIKEARKEICASTINYLEAVDVTLDEKEVKEVEELFDVLFDEFEKSLKQAKQNADILDRIMKDMKESNPKPTLRRVNLSDDEKLLNFLRKISE